MNQNRMLVCARTQRNVDRITRRFQMEHDWKGHFTSRLGNGYKLASRDNTKLIFVFTEKGKS